MTRAQMKKEVLYHKTCPTCHQVRICYQFLCCCGSTWGCPFVLRVLIPASYLSPITASNCNVKGRLSFRSYLLTSFEILPAPLEADAGDSWNVCCSTENVSCSTLCVGLCLQQEVWGINQVLWHKNTAPDSDCLLWRNQFSFWLAELRSLKWILFKSGSHE